MKFEPDPALTAELINEGLAKGKLPYATVTSDSMSPLLLRGDEVQIAPVNAAELKPGVVILLAKPDGFLAHRYWQTCHQSDGTYFITRGDRSPEFDPPSPDNNLVGQIIARRRDSRRLSLTNGPGSWLNRRLAALSRWDVSLRNKNVIVSKIEDNGSDDHHHGQQSLGAKISHRLLYIIAIILTTLVNTTTKS